MAHPADLELELVHLGEPAPEVSQHVAQCERCQRFLQQLEQGKERTWRRQSPEAYAPWLRQRRSERAAQRAARSHWLMGVSGALALAASLALVLPAVLRDEAATADTGPGTAEDLRAKGAAAAPRAADSRLSIVRVRGGQTQVFREVVPVAPNDTLALRFFLPAPGQLSAGILTDAGEWAAFFDGAQFAAGNHVPELTLQVNDEPGSGRVLLGPPEQVAAARAGKPAPDVQSARIVWSRQP